jgi:hypothetical protein
LGGTLLSFVGAAKAPWRSSTLNSDSEIVPIRNGGQPPHDKAGTQKESCERRFEQKKEKMELPLLMTHNGNLRGSFDNPSVASALIIWGHPKTKLSIQKDSESLRLTLANAFFVAPTFVVFLPTSCL